MIGLPVFYGMLGFIMGAIAALVYNILAGMAGGIKFELEGVQQEYAAATAASVGAEPVSCAVDLTDARGGRSRS